jgi:hypothetical protein
MNQQSSGARMMKTFQLSALLGRWLIVATVLAGGTWAHAAALPTTLFEYPEAEVESRWYTPENPQGLKGQGAMANQGAKGSPFGTIAAGETVSLLDVEGSGIVQRMWITLSEFSPVSLRALRLDMYWDKAETPAVSVPLGDFMAAINGKILVMENALFSSPEGKSFNCIIPMPFRTAARIDLTNESDNAVRLYTYEINVLHTPRHEEEVLYFHTSWRRERWTELGRDFEILPKVTGKGRFLGAHIGVIQKEENEGWWGEGEVKVYLDGDEEFPTLSGTGTEDHIGAAWGQQVFQNRYTGSLFNEDGQIGFYRYHIPDPLYFREDCRVTVQVMGSMAKKLALEFFKKEGVEVKPVAIVSIQNGLHYTNLLEEEPDRTVEGPMLYDQEWIIFYRRDDYSATAYFYLDRPENGLPALASLEARTEGLSTEKPEQAPQ